MRTKFVAAIVLSASVLGFQASALAAQDVTTHHRTATTTQKVQQRIQPAPRYFDEYYDQNQATPDGYNLSGAAGGLGH